MKKKKTKLNMINQNVIKYMISELKVNHDATVKAIKNEKDKIL